MKLLAVTVNYRTPDLTLKAVQALMPALNGISAKVSIVDNDSQDGSYEKLKKGVEEHSEWAGQVEVIASGHNGGFGFGNNVAIRKAFASDDPPDFVYLLNSDAFPKPDTIQIMLDYMAKNPRVGAVGSGVIGEDDVPHVTAFRFPDVGSEFEGNIRLGFLSNLLKSHVVPIIPIPENACEVGWVAGASMLMRKEMLDEVGMFDEDYFLYFEETDLSLRAYRAGWPTHYLPDAVVVHLGSASTGYKYNKRRAEYWFDSRRRFFEKNYGKINAEFADVAFVGGQLVYLARRVIEKKEQLDPDLFLLDFLSHKFGLPRVPKSK